VQILTGVKPVSNHGEGKSSMSSWTTGRHCRRHGGDGRWNTLAHELARDAGWSWETAGSSVDEFPAYR